MLRCILLAVTWAGLGLALRMAVSPLPVDEPYRNVLRAYGTPDSNTPETSQP